jgi:hypothetical protein
MTGKLLAAESAQKVTSFGNPSLSNTRQRYSILRYRINPLSPQITFLYPESSSSPCLAIWLSHTKKTCCRQRENVNVQSTFQRNDTFGRTHP